MKIPKKLKIGAHTYKVSFEIDPSNDNDNCFGCCSYKKLTIKINSSYAVSQQEETFIHEILHCILHQEGIEEKEQEVQAIAHAMYQVLKDNDLLK